jgi:hypothetical protein
MLICKKNLALRISLLHWRMMNIELNLLNS